jgi:predicted nucleotidyltransferase
VIGLPAEWRARITSWAASQPKIVRVGVFGSRARGDHRPDSDVDLAIVVAAEPDLQTVIVSDAEFPAWRRQVHKMVPVELDLVWANPDEVGLLFHSKVAQDVIKIYERETP